MTQKNKQLLISDLSARLPYGVMVSVNNGAVAYINEIRSIEICTDYRGEISDYRINEESIEYVKPFLFPMASMTDEQRGEYNTICSNEWCDLNYGDIDAMYKSIDYLNAHHFDYRGLIERNLGLDVTGLNIY